MRHVHLAFGCAAVALACQVERHDADWLTDPAYPSLAGHDRYLVLAGTPHDPTAADNPAGCDGCHPSTTFRVYHCTGCHAVPAADAFHAGVGRYPAPGTVTSADCYGCHPQGVGLIAAGEHERYFPIGTAAHPAVCTQCHADPTRRSDLSTLRCAACHASVATSTGASLASAHAAVNDYPRAPTDAWCIRCHADAQVDAVAAHGAHGDPAGLVAGDAGPGLPAGKHTNAGCLDCHTMVPPAFPNPAGAAVPDRPWAQNWPIASCNKTGCH